MFRKYIYITISAILFVVQANAQYSPNGSSGNRQGNSEMDAKSSKNKTPEKPNVPSHIKTWKVGEHGSLISKNELDTTSTFYHIYQPIFQKSISSTFTGNNGGANISNDFFARNYASDFYFTHSYDCYWLTPDQINYFNTTTPYSTLDYSQSENRSSKSESRFNVLLTQNVNKKFNFGFMYNQTKSEGHYLNQLNKFHNIALISSYNSNNFVSHSNIIFNRLQGQENGGLDSRQTFDNATATDEFVVQITDDAINRVQNNNIFTVNEYRLGKKIEADSANNIKESFIPRVGFMHEFELSNNKRAFSKDDPTTFFNTIYLDSTKTADSTRYTRVTNIFQIKFYEAPDRKYTFGKRAYIGNDQLWYSFASSTGYYQKKQSNTFIGGGIFRNQGKFWQWEANGRIYLTGYRAGQTELTGYINKPLTIGRDTTSLRVEGSIKTLVPDYYQRYFYSNHFQWSNNFDNINEMTIKSSIHSQTYKTTLGVNYSLIGNYIYNDKNVLPAQAGSELLVLSAYLNKDFESDHWVVRMQGLIQKANNENLVHLPTFAGFASINYRTIVSKVLYFQLGADVRYNSAFYADAYDPGTSRFYLQNSQKIGNYPYVDLHANLKLKRTRIFFNLLNAGSGLVGNNYFVAPDYPYYRRTFRLGLAWSFYD